MDLHHHVYFVNAVSYCRNDCYLPNCNLYILYEYILERVCIFMCIFILLPFSFGCIFRRLNETKLYCLSVSGVVPEPAG